MSDAHERQDRDRWARLRFSIIGSLLAAPPAQGELRGALLALSAKTWRHPRSELPISFAASTIERWYYAARAARQDPVAALKTRVRVDCGQQRGLSPALIEALAAQYRAHPRVELKPPLVEMVGLQNELIERLEIGKDVRGGPVCYDIFSRFLKRNPRG